MNWNEAEKVAGAIEDSTEDPKVIDAVCRNLNAAFSELFFWRVGVCSMRWGPRNNANAGGVRLRKTL